MTSKNRGKHKKPEWEKVVEAIFSRQAADVIKWMVRLVRERRQKKI